MPPATGGLYAPAGATVSIHGTSFGDGGAKLLERSDGTVYDVTPTGLAALDAAGLGAGNRIGRP